MREVFLAMRGENSPDIVVADLGLNQEGHRALWKAAGCDDHLVEPEVKGAASQTGPAASAIIAIPVR